MEFYDTVNARRTIRDFDSSPIDDITIRRIIDAGMKAPTNDHMRNWRFIVVKDKSVIARLLQPIPKSISEEDIQALIKDWKLNDICQQGCYRDAVPKQYWMFCNASCVLIPLFKKTSNILHPENLSQLNPFASIWCCIENIFLATTAEGYSSALRIPLGDEDKWTAEVLGYPEDYMMACMIAIGKPTPEAFIVPQKPYSLESVIHKDRW